MANLKIIIGAKDIIPIPEFDFLVVRYFWDYDGGQDLDTATGIVDTNIPQINNKSVGYKATGSVSQLGNTNSPYLKWGSDNTATGYESVLIDPSSLYTEHPELQDQINILLTSVWWSTKRSGDVSFSITTYIGGTMSLEDFNYINNGGQQVFTQNFIKNIESTNRASVEDENFQDAEGNKLGKIIFKNSDNTAKLQLL